MPLTRISLRRGKPPDYIAAIIDQLYAAITEAFDVPPDDLFAIVTQHEPEDFFYNRSYLGIARDDDFVVFQVTANNTRTTARKQDFYKALAERLARHPGIAPQNVMISLVEVTKDDWSFGNGIAQYVEPP
jgi:phenylpyruvate tautomerase PptA (4-oxalocrotonate tautomerase family)